MNKKDKLITEVFIISLIVLAIITFPGCGSELSHYELHGKEATIIYNVEDYLVHDTGVEIWAESEDGEVIGFFVPHEDVYYCEYDSRVIALYSCREKCNLYAKYLYLDGEDFIEYTKEIYNIE